MEQGVYWADIAFPVLSFCMTIVMPSCVAVWVIYRTLREVRRNLSAPKTASGPATPAAPAKPR